MPRSMMRVTLFLAAPAALFLFLAGAACERASSPGAQMTAAALADRIVEAHGGLEAWNQAPSIRYEHTVSFPPPPNGATTPPWRSREVVEQSSVRRVHQDWLSHGGQLVWDGVDVWSTDWSLPNPPRMMPYMVFTTLVAPWITQDPNVTLEGPGREMVPGDSLHEYLTLTIHMPNDPARPPTAPTFKIFVDPESYRMKALSYSVTYGPMLDRMGAPPQVSEIGPITQIYDEFALVDGLTVPVKYHTIGPDGGLAASHEVRDWAFDQPFDLSRMRRPANAVVDRGRDVRRLAS